MDDKIAGNSFLYLRKALSLAIGAVAELGDDGCACGSVVS